MQILALETDDDKLKKRFLSAEELEIVTVHFHGFRFFLTVIRQLFWMALLIAAAVGLDYTGVPAGWLTIGACVVWLIFLAPTLLREYIDWAYDLLLVTTDKVILIDQTSIFHQKITPMNLENFASVTAETQFFNLFSFGILRFNLKEGVGSGVHLPYIPHAHDVASRISDAITTFQRRKDLRRYGGTHHEEGMPIPPSSAPSTPPQTPTPGPASA